MATPQAPAQQAVQAPPNQAAQRPPAAQQVPAQQAANGAQAPRARKPREASAPRPRMARTKLTADQIEAIQDGAQAEAMTIAAAADYKTEGVNLASEMAPALISFLQEQSAEDQTAYVVNFNAVRRVFTKALAGNCTAQTFRMMKQLARQQPR